MVTKKKDYADCEILAVGANFTKVINAIAIEVSIQFDKSMKDKRFLRNKKLKEIDDEITALLLKYFTESEIIEQIC